MNRDYSFSERVNSKFVVKKKKVHTSGTSSYQKLTKLSKILEAAEPKGQCGEAAMVKVRQSEL